MNEIDFQLITKEVSIVKNDLPKGQFTIAPTFTRNTGSIDDDHVFTELILELTNTEERPFPVDIRVSMMGVFARANIPEEAMDNFLKVQAVQIILPYMRAIITNLTSAAFMPPLILPVFDVRKIFEE